MKSFLLVSTVFLGLTVAHGQTNVYHPFPEDTATWVVDNYIDPNNYNSPDCYSFTHPYTYYCSSWIYLMKGDTIINGTSYNKIYYLGGVTFDGAQYPIITCQGCSGNYSYSFAIRQDSINKKVYYRDTTMTSDTLLYNFNLTIGDTLPLTFGNNLAYPTIISSIDSVLISNSYHKRFKLNNNYHALIEGVGWDCDLRNVFFIPEGSCDLRCFDSKHSFYSGECGIVVTSNSEIEKNNEFEIFPNPFSTQTILRTDNFLHNATLTIYNSLGQQVKQLKNISGQTITLHRDNLPSGLYFIRLTQENKIVTTDKLVITDN